MGTLHLQGAVLTEDAANTLQSNNRFSPASLSQALYVADGMDMALREATQAYHAIFHQPEIPAHAVYPVHIRTTRLLDLTDVGVRALLGVSLMTLTGDWRGAAILHAQHPEERVETHELGIAAFEAGLESIRYPSTFDPMRANTVLFTEHLAHSPEAQLPDDVHLARQLLRGDSGGPPA